MMTLKWIGAILVIFACGGFGYSLAAANKREERSLQDLLRSIEFMICELEFHHTPLPDLCALAGAETGGVVGKMFSSLASQLERQVLADVPSCLRVCLENYPSLPSRTQQNLMNLGQCMGRFALSGQISVFRGAAELCRRDLASLALNRDARLRSYKTLGICCGVALVILFL